MITTDRTPLTTCFVLSSRIGVDDQDLGDGAAESPTNSGVLGKKHNLLSRNETISAKKRKADELDPADKVSPIPYVLFQALSTI